METWQSDRDQSPKISQYPLVEQGKNTVTIP